MFDNNLTLREKSILFDILNKEKINILQDKNKLQKEYSDSLICPNTSILYHQMHARIASLQKFADLINSICSKLGVD